MNTIRNLLHSNDGKALIGTVALLALVLFAGTTIAATDKAKDVDEQRRAKPTSLSRAMMKRA